MGTELQFELNFIARCKYYLWNITMKLTLIKRGSEIWTCTGLECSKRGLFVNGLDLKSGTALFKQFPMCLLRYLWVLFAYCWVGCMWRMPQSLSLFNPL